jgi:hypothetical protein
MECAFTGALKVGMSDCILFYRVHSLDVMLNVWKVKE